MQQPLVIAYHLIWTAYGWWLPNDPRGSGSKTIDSDIIAELGELHNAMDRHDGLFYLAAGAGFVADHQAQGDRLDFGGLFKAYRDQFPFLVGGSDEDPFEHRQVDLAQERLGKLGLRIERLPGGHLTTHEQPEALAALIAKFEQGLAREPERAEDYSD